MRTAILLLAAAASTAQADWTFINLHPAGTTESAAYGVGITPGGVRQVGYATVGGAPHAAMWSGAAAGWVDLNPIAGAASTLYGVDGNLQVGAVGASGFSAASTWSGTAGSWVNISGGFHSTALCVSNGLVGGSYRDGTIDRSCTWTGSTMTPLGGRGITGVSFGVRVTNQVAGSFPFTGTEAFMYHAGSGTAISLEPANGYFSGVNAASGGLQAGWIHFDSLTGPVHAIIWNGNPSSYVDVHPAVARESRLTGISTGVQCGNVRVVDPDDINMNLVTHASAWFGTAGSWVDLHAFLPAGFRESFATGAYSADGQTVYIVGHGVNNTTGRREALLWVHTPTQPPQCGTADFDGDGDTGTDADIEAFFACLAGSCCPTCFAGGADFNGDGDTGTDADIEAFFRVLAGGSC
jgi:hypothetical protein